MNNVIDTRTWVIAIASACLWASLFLMAARRDRQALAVLALAVTLIALAMVIQ